MLMSKEVTIIYLHKIKVALDSDNLPTLTTDAKIITTVQGHTKMIVQYCWIYNNKEIEYKKAEALKVKETEICSRNHSS